MPPRATLALPALLAVACGAPPTTTTTTAPAAPRPAPVTTTPPRWPAPCPSIAGLDGLLVPGATLVFGELHGTEEVPRFVGDVACHAAAAPVTLALEVPRDEQPRLDAYLASSGDAGARADLLAGPFWHRATQDGRSSAAMAGLLERVRGARAAGVDITVLAFDIAGPGPRPRDQEMAAAIAAARRAAPTRTFIVLAGNYHSRRTDGAPWDPAAKWMTGYLAGDGIALTTFDLAHRGGSIWACMGDDPASAACQEHPVRGAPVDATWRLAREAGVEGHDGRYAVGDIHASPPAAP